MEMEHEEIPQEPTALERLRALVDKAEHQQTDVLPEIQEILDDHPEIWRHFGDLAGHAERAWIRLLAGDSPHVHESLLRAANAMRGELGGATPGPLERLLVERVIASWLQVRYFEIAAAAVEPASEPASRQATTIEKRLDGAQKRHLAAIKALADLRRLLPNTAATPAEQGAEENAGAGSQPSARRENGDARRSAADADQAACRDELPASAAEDACTILPIQAAR